MKDFVRLLLLALWPVALPSYAQADCTMQLNPMVLDFGSQTRDGLQASNGGAALSFGSRRMHLNVQCSEPQPMGLRFEAPAVDAQHYRFGPGILQMRLLSARLDGQTVNWFRESDGAQNVALLRPGDRIRPRLDGQPLAGQHWRLELDIETLLSPQATRVRDITPYQASGRFQLD
jgi:hypothetical protein